MGLKDLGYYKLDGNIDGFYVDIEGNIVTVNDMIGVIGAADGPAAYPDNTALQSPLSKEDLLSLKNVGLSPTIIKNTRGHGLLYDKEGNHIGDKGQLFLKDGKGNFTTLYNLLDKSRLINEKRGITRLKDTSLFLAGYTSSIGITLDEMIKFVELSFTSFSKGNILQVARNFTVNGNNLTIPTISLREEAKIWVVARATTSGSGMLKLMSGESVLDEVKYDNKGTETHPAYISYVGSIPITSSDPISEGCDMYTWDFVSKSFKKEKNNTEDLLYNYDLKLVGDVDYKYASINLLCFEDASRDIASIKTGSDIITKKDARTTYDVIFDDSYDDDKYSISIQLEDNLQTWYSNKNLNGFTINIEREYEGRVYWTAIKK